MNEGRVRAGVAGWAALAVVLLCLGWGAAPAQEQRGSAQGTGVAGAQVGGVARAEGSSESWRAALEQVSAESMRGHLSFLSSDALEGRGTPSRGLDIAAEYIAAQFRRAGLEPAGDDGYFQTANWTLAGRAREGFEMRLTDGARALSVGAAEASLGVSSGGFTLWQPSAEIALADAGLFKVDYGDAARLAALTREQLAGRAVVAEVPDFRRAEGPRRLAAAREVHAFLARMHTLGVPLVITFTREPARGGRERPRLVDPEAATRTSSPLDPDPTAPLVVVHGPDGVSFYEALPAGATSARLVFRAPAPTSTPVRLRNVAGILRGSDPALRDTYVIVSAHYDHVGMRVGCDPSKEDCVYNGANDDGSGTVGVIELASALSRPGRRPRRSILFLTFFGEEMGLLGSRYYGRHPLVPLAKTVAQINLEQIGRTDDSEGPQVGTLGVTGFDYSEVGGLLQRAGEAEGVRVYKHPTKSDAYFSRSDNQSLADAGVPAHTLSVAYEFPDYHGAGDEWPKIDYANMARVTRAIGRAALSIADSAQEPRWNEQNPKAAPYLEAWRKMQGK